MTQSNQSSNRAGETPIQRASLLGLTYAGLGYLSFHAAFGYLVFFVNGILVPKTVEDGTRHGLLAAIGINLGLIVLWGLQHSVMARRSFKQRLQRILPQHLERATFVVASSAALFTVMLGWAPVDGTLWQLESSALRGLVTGLGITGWLLVVAASFEIDHFELLGFKQALVAHRGQTLPEHAFQSRYIYRFVRHPIQTGILLGMWCAPTLTASRALFASLMTLYVLVGLFFEERDLIRQFGARYVQYRREVPQLIPFANGPRPAAVVRPGSSSLRPQGAIPVVRRGETPCNDR
jgi:protein-S-isoprenylcysteine O-methyltransferase Ste14